MARNNRITVLLLLTMICTVMTEDVNSTLEDVLRIATYNSKGFSDNRKLVISDLLLFNDIVHIQEHWLFDGQLHQVNISNDHQLPCPEWTQHLEFTSADRMGVLLLFGINV